MTGRFDRQLPLLGSEGQEKLRAARVAVIGAGGTGSFVIPQLALLGVGELTFVDHDDADYSTRNRHLCVRAADPVPGTPKVRAAERMVLEFDPTIKVHAVRASLLSPEGFAAVKEADYVFGCIDLEGIRLVLTELCAAYSKPYIDVASGVEPGVPTQYGGRVCCAIGGRGCLACLGELDPIEAGQDLETAGQRRDRRALYGVDQSHLARTGPSVVSLNGVVASLAVTEFMKLATGLAEPCRLLRYDGRQARVSVRTDAPRPDCFFCKSVWATGSDAEVERYLPLSPSGTT